MIIRNARGTRGINPASEEIMLKLSYTIADIRGWVEYYYQLIGLLTFTKLDFMYFLRHTYLQFFAGKWQDVICEWAWNASLRHSFVLETESGYIVSVKHIRKQSGKSKEPYFLGM